MKNALETEKLDDWRYDVANGDTRLGFEDWKKHNAASGLGGPAAVGVTNDLISIIWPALDRGADRSELRAIIHNVFDSYEPEEQ
jgi:hypothetical protein